MIGILPKLKAWAAIAGAVVLALAAAFLKGRASGKQSAVAKQARRDLKARDDLIDMQREAHRTEQKAAALSDEEARKEAMKWAN